MSNHYEQQLKQEFQKFIPHKQHNNIDLELLESNVEIIIQKYGRIIGAQIIRPSILDVVQKSIRQIKGNKVLAKYHAIKVLQLQNKQEYLNGVLQQIKWEHQQLARLEHRIVIQVDGNPNNIAIYFPNQQLMNTVANFINGNQLRDANLNFPQHIKQYSNQLMANIIQNVAILADQKRNQQQFQIFEIQKQKVGSLIHKKKNQQEVLDNCRKERKEMKERIEKEKQEKQLFEQQVLIMNKVVNKKKNQQEVLDNCRQERREMKERIEKEKQEKQLFEQQVLIMNKVVSKKKNQQELLDRCRQERREMKERMEREMQEQGQKLFEKQKYLMGKVIVRRNSQQMRLDNCRKQRREMKERIEREKQEQELFEKQKYLMNVVLTKKKSQQETLDRCRKERQEMKEKMLIEKSQEMDLSRFKKDRKQEQQWMIVQPINVLIKAQVVLQPYIELEIKRKGEQQDRSSGSQKIVVNGQQLGIDEYGVYYRQKIQCRIYGDREGLIEWRMSDCMYRIEGDCMLVIKVYDEMGDSNYMAMVEMDVDQVSEYVQMKIPQMNSKMVGQQVVIQFIRFCAENTIDLDINYYQIQQVNQWLDGGLDELNRTFVNHNIEWNNRKRQINRNKYQLLVSSIKQSSSVKQCLSDHRKQKGQIDEMARIQINEMLKNGVNNEYRSEFIELLNTRDYEHDGLECKNMDDIIDMYGIICEQKNITVLDNIQLMVQCLLNQSQIMDIVGQDLIIEQNQQQIIESLVVLSDYPFISSLLVPILNDLKLPFLDIRIDQLLQQNYVLYGRLIDLLVYAAFNSIEIGKMMNMIYYGLLQQIKKEFKDQQWNNIEKTKLQIEVGVHLIKDYDKLVETIIDSKPVIDQLYCQNIQKPYLQIGQQHLQGISQQLKQCLEKEKLQQLSLQLQIQQLHLFRNSNSGLKLIVLLNNHVLQELDILIETMTVFDHLISLDVKFSDVLLFRINNGSETMMENMIEIEAFPLNKKCNYQLIMNDLESDELKKEYLFPSYLSLSLALDVIEKHKVMELNQFQELFQFSDYDATIKQHLYSIYYGSGLEMVQYLMVHSDPNEIGGLSLNQLKSVLVLYYKYYFPDLKEEQFNQYIDLLHQGQCQSILSVMMTINNESMDLTSLIQKHINHKNNLQLSSNNSQHLDILKEMVVRDQKVKQLLASNKDNLELTIKYRKQNYEWEQKWKLDNRLMIVNGGTDKIDLNSYIVLNDQQVSYIVRNLGYVWRQRKYGEKQSRDQNRVCLQGYSYDQYYNESMQIQPDLSSKYVKCIVYEKQQIYVEFINQPGILHPRSKHQII